MFDRALVAGVLVGGGSRRFGGVPKGLLRHPSEPTTLVEHAVALCRSVGAETMLVGCNAAYVGLGVPMLDDAFSQAGPIGGLAALVGYAGSRRVVTLACDMPYVGLELLSRLIARSDQSAGICVIPRRSSGLEPLCALYNPHAVRALLADALQTGGGSLQWLLARIEKVELEIRGEEEHWLDDWDGPSDQGG